MIIAPYLTLWEIYLNWQNCFLYGSQDWALTVPSMSGFQQKHVLSVFLGWLFCTLQADTFFFIPHIAIFYPWQ